MRAFFRDAVSEVTNRVTASRLVSKATSSSEKLELDEDEASEIANFANTVSSSLIVSNVKSRLDSKTPASQYLTMRLIQFLVDNCASTTHTELAKDIGLHQRLIQLASSLQEVEPGAARTAVKVRLEARKLLLELSRTFQGCDAAQMPLSTLQQKFEAMTQKKLERSVLMAPQRIRFRPPNEDDIRLISPRGKRGSLTALRKEQEEREKERLAREQQEKDGQEENNNGGAAASSSSSSNNTTPTTTGEIISVAQGELVVDTDDVKQAEVVVVEGSIISTPPPSKKSDYNENDDDEKEHADHEHFTSPGDPLTAEEKNHPKLCSPRGRDDKEFVAAALHHNAEEAMSEAKNDDNNDDNDTAAKATPINSRSSTEESATTVEEEDQTTQETEKEEVTEKNNENDDDEQKETNENEDEDAAATKDSNSNGEKDSNQQQQQQQPKGGKNKRKRFGGGKK